MQTHMAPARPRPGVRGTNLPPPSVSQHRGAFPCFCKQDLQQVSGTAREVGSRSLPTSSWAPPRILLSLTLRSFPSGHPTPNQSGALQGSWGLSSVTSLVLQGGKPTGSLGGQLGAGAPRSEHPGWMGPNPFKGSCFSPHLPRSPPQWGPLRSLYLKWGL